MGNSGRTFEEMIDTGASMLDCSDVSINAIGVTHFAAGESIAVSTPDHVDDDGLAIKVLHLFLKTQEGESYEFVLMDRDVETLHTALTRMALSRMQDSLSQGELDDAPPEIQEMMKQITEVAADALEKESTEFKDFDHGA